MGQLAPIGGTPARRAEGLRLAAATLRYVANEVDGEGYWRDLATTLRENATDLAETATSIEIARVPSRPCRERRRWFALLPSRWRVGTPCDPTPRGEDC